MWKICVKQGIFIVLLVSLLLVTNDAAQAIGVRPLVMELNVRPGDQREFEIDLTPGDLEEIVDVALYESVQQLDGGLIYQLPIYPAFSATSWITLDKYTVQVHPNEESTIKGTLRVPFSAKGSHSVIIMVEPRPLEKRTGITFSVRYAVRLIIRVESAGLRPSAELSLFEVAPDEQKMPRIAVRVKNTSALDYPVSGDVTIRDESRHLVERITLQAGGASSVSSDVTIIYPGSEVELAGQISRPLSPGEYSLQAFLRYGNTGQILRNEKLVINPGDYEFPVADLMGVYEISPATVEQTMRAGEQKSQVFEFQSNDADPIRIEFSLTDVVPEYEHSVVEWVIIRSQQEFILPARARTRLALTIAVPREARDGSYHGNVIFRAYKGTSDNKLTETVVPISVLVGEEHRDTVEIRSIAAQKIEGEGTYVSLDIQNTGNISIRPSINLVISNEAGDIIRRASLGLPEGITHVLPLQTQHFGSLLPELELGQYQVEVRVSSGAREILAEKREISIIKEASSE